MGYLSVAKPHERLEAVKGSKFIALVTPVQSVDEVEAHLGAVRARHPDASHHCFAYRCGEQIRFSDDGEPGGTAGRPMLEVLTKRGLEHVLGVVTRYFGGTKLGAGGLIRAYSGALAKALDEAGTVRIEDRSALSFEVPFSAMDSVHRLLDDWPELVKGDPGFSARGMQLEVDVLEADVARLKENLVSLSRGEVRFLSE